MSILDGGILLGGTPGSGPGGPGAMGRRGFNAVSRSIMATLIPQGQFPDEGEARVFTGGGIGNLTFGHSEEHVAYFNNLHPSTLLTVRVDGNNYIQTRLNAEQHVDLSQEDVVTLNFSVIEAIGTVGNSGPVHLDFSQAQDGVSPESSLNPGRAEAGSIHGPDVITPHSGRFNLGANASWHNAFSSVTGLPSQIQRTANQRFRQNLGTSRITFNGVDWGSQGDAAFLVRAIQGFQLRELNVIIRVTRVNGDIENYTIAHMTADPINIGGGSDETVRMTSTPRTITFAQGDTFEFLETSDPIENPATFSVVGGGVYYPYSLFLTEDGYILSIDEFGLMKRSGGGAQEILFANLAQGLISLPGAPVRGDRIAVMIFPQGTYNTGSVRNWQLDGDADTTLFSAIGRNVNVPPEVTKNNQLGWYLELLWGQNVTGTVLFNFGDQKNASRRLYINNTTVYINCGIGNSSTGQQIQIGNLSAGVTVPTNVEMRVHLHEWIA